MSVKDEDLEHFQLYWIVVDWYGEHRVKLARYFTTDFLFVVEEGYANGKRDIPLCDVKEVVAKVDRPDVPEQYASAIPPTRIGFFDFTAMKLREVKHLKALDAARAITYRDVCNAKEATVASLDVESNDAEDR